MHAATGILMLAACLAVTSACDDPPESKPAQIDIDAETEALRESVDEVRQEADERVSSPDASEPSD